jgi:SAM-dependent methyltransferase
VRDLVTQVQADPGSFRDPRSRVFVADGQILRALDEEGAADWRSFTATSAAAELLGSGKLIGTEALETDDVPDQLRRSSPLVLRHERIPFVSYPYEWPFGMLQAAALLQLELLRRVLADDFVLKDSSPYNVQWRGTRPVFIDVGSLEPLAPGEPWVGYRQFCMLYLYPLLLQAFRDVPFQPWLRGSVDGITPGECRHLLSFRDRFRKGVFTHVVMHARLDKRYADTTRDVRRELKGAGFKKELIVANVTRLERMIRRLEWSPSSSPWSDYGATDSYSEEDAARKLDFVRSAAGARRWPRVWDLGCNDGRFSRAVSAHADYVVAVDGDAAVVERLYEELRSDENETILPLTMNIVDPSPGLGWRGLERRTLADRGTPDLTLCLALVHHVAITGNVPIPEFLDWLRSLETSLVIEFPTPEDPMVKRLLAAKRDRTHADYNRTEFERALHARFDVDESLELASATRVLYRARPAA